MIDVAFAEGRLTVCNRAAGEASVSVRLRSQTVTLAPGEEAHLGL